MFSLILGIAYLNSKFKINIIYRRRKNMKVGYVRVSSVGQHEDRQLETLKEMKMDKIYMEKVSGKNTDREQLKLMLDFVRENDEVYVTDFSRMSRSTRDLLDIIENMKEKKVRLISLKENFDTDTATGKLMITMIGAINEFERANILERQREGIAIAKRQGKYKGRPKKKLENFDTVYQEWKNDSITVTSACELLGISRVTFYKRVREKEA